MLLLWNTSMNLLRTWTWKAGVSRRRRLIHSSPWEYVWVVRFKKRRKLIENQVALVYPTLKTSFFRIRSLKLLYICLLLQGVYGYLKQPEKYQNAKKIINYPRMIFKLLNMLTYFRKFWWSNKDYGMSAFINSKNVSIFFGNIVEHKLKHFWIIKWNNERNNFKIFKYKLIKSNFVCTYYLKLMRKITYTSNIGLQ